MCGCMNPLRCCAPRRPFSEQKGEDVAVRTRGILRCRFAPRKGRLAFVHLVHPHPSPLPLRERGHRRRTSPLDSRLRGNDGGCLVD